MAALCPDDAVTEVGAGEGFVGLKEGARVGIFVAGVWDGARVDGTAVGLREGRVVGTIVGLREGRAVNVGLGEAGRKLRGARVGFVVGTMDGELAMVFKSLVLSIA
jgi:hypothetical protein